MKNFDVLAARLHWATLMYVSSAVLSRLKPNDLLITSYKLIVKFITENWVGG